jgi:hypothetical protein
MASRMMEAQLCRCGRALALALLGAVLALPESPPPQPRYRPDGQLVRPEGYREWIFVGANLNMGYREGAPPPKEDRFHNIYLPREAYRHFAATGQFPDKTMLVMEVVRGATHASINRRGTFQDQLVGIEVAVKDTARYAEAWAYFNFIGPDGQPLPAARPFPREACWDCHHRHGAADNVFVQFYPVLRDLRPRP